MTVVFTGRNETRGEAVAAATGARFLRCDARDRAASDRAVEEALAVGGGRLDVLVANAGILMGGPIEETPEAAFRELLEVNLTALFRVSRACFGSMREQGGGSMIHICSDSGIRGIHEICVLGDEGRRRGCLRALCGRRSPWHPRQRRVPGRRRAGRAGHTGRLRAPRRVAGGWTLPPSGRFGTGEDVAALVAGWPPTSPRT